jgi:hypothetical protein
MLSFALVDRNAGVVSRYWARKRDFVPPKRHPERLPRPGAIGAAGDLRNALSGAQGDADPPEFRTGAHGSNLERMRNGGSLHWSESLSARRLLRCAFWLAPI